MISNDISCFVLLKRDKIILKTNFIFETLNMIFFLKKIRSLEDFSSGWRLVHLAQIFHFVMNVYESGQCVLFKARVIRLFSFFIPLVFKWDPLLDEFVTLEKSRWGR